MGLDPEYLMDEYVYLINNDGSDGIFKGFSGKANQKVDAPYVVCPVHTKKAWEKYQKQNPPEESTPVEDDNTQGSKPSNRIPNTQKD